MKTDRRNGLWIGLLLCLVLATLTLGTAVASAEDIPLQQIRGAVHGQLSADADFASVDLNQHTYELNQNQQVQLALVGDTMSVAQVLWRSSNEDLVRVERDGFVYCANILKETSKVTVTATVVAWDGQTKTLQCVITVPGQASAQPIKGVPAVSPSQTFMRESLYLYPTEVFGLAPTLAAGRQVSGFTSSNSQVASVDNQGTVNALQPGSATLTLELAGTPSQKVNTESMVLPAFTAQSSGPRVSVSHLILWPGERIKPAYTVPMEYEGQVQWSSDDPSVVSVSADGMITTVGGGSTLVRLKTVDGAYEVGVWVEVPKVEIEIPDSRLNASGYLELREGESYTISAKHEPLDLPGVVVSALSSNSGVVSVNGMTITAQQGAAGKRATITVVAATREGVVMASLQVLVTPRQTTSSGGGGGSSSGGSSGGSTSITGLALTPGSMTLSVGQTGQLRASYTPTGAVAPVTFTSSNTSIATVSSSGLVTGVSPGTATITARTLNGRYSATSYITVTGTSDTTSVTLTPATATMNVGESRSFTTTVVSSTTQTVSYSTSNASIVSITQSSNSQVTVKANANGTATITATLSPSGKTATATITVGSGRIPLTGLKLEPERLILEVNHSPKQQLTPKFTPENASNKGLIWESDNSSIVSVDQTGTLTAHAITPGDTYVTITARSQENSSIYAQAYIKVVQKIVTGLSAVSPQTVYLGTEKAIGLVFAPAGVADREKGVSAAVTSGDPNVVSWKFDANKTPVTWVPLKVGDVTVTFTSTMNPSVSTSVLVMVRYAPVKGVEIDLSSIANEYIAGVIPSVQPKATVIGEEGGEVDPANKVVTWSVINQDPANPVARINASGQLEPLRRGTATLVATAGGKQATVQINVRWDNPGEFIVEPTDIELTPIVPDNTDTLVVIRLEPEFGGNMGDWTIRWPDDNNYLKFVPNGTGLECVVTAFDATRILPYTYTDKAVFERQDDGYSLESNRFTITVSWPKVLSATIWPNPVELTSPTMTENLTIIAKNADGSDAHVEAERWWTANSSIASVDEDTGVITGLKAGERTTVYVSALINGEQRELRAEVIVRYADLADLEIEIVDSTVPSTADQLTANTKTQHQLESIIITQPANWPIDPAANVEKKWRVETLSGTNVATITNDGLLTLTGAGTIRVWAELWVDGKLKDSDMSDILTVTWDTLKGIRVVPETDTMYVNELDTALIELITTQDGGVYNPALDSTAKFSWSNTNAPDVVQVVSGTGNITWGVTAELKAVAVGTGTYRVEMNEPYAGLSNTFTRTVDYDASTVLEIRPDEMTLNIGETRTLTATVTTANGGYEGPLDLTWPQTDTWFKFEVSADGRSCEVTALAEKDDKEYTIRIVGQESVFDVVTLTAMEAPWNNASIQPRKVVIDPVTGLIEDVELVIDWKDPANPGQVLGLEWRVGETTIATTPDATKDQLETTVHGVKPGTTYIEVSATIAGRYFKDSVPVEVGHGVPIEIKIDPASIPDAADRVVGVTPSGPLTVNVTATNPDGWPHDPSKYYVKWSVNDESVATIGEDSGLLTYVGAGTVRVTASMFRIGDTTNPIVTSETLTVGYTDILDVQIVPDEMTLYAGQESDLAIRLTTSSGVVDPNLDVSVVWAWTGSNTNVVTVGDNESTYTSTGLSANVYANKNAAGTGTYTATITIKGYGLPTEGKTFTRSFTAHVDWDTIAQVIVSPSYAEVVKGETQPLTARVIATHQPNGNVGPVTVYWTDIADLGYFDFSGSGSALTDGQAMAINVAVDPTAIPYTVRVTNGNSAMVSDPFSLKPIWPEELVTVTLDPTILYVKKGESVNLPTVTATYAGGGAATIQQITWSISPEDIATLNAGSTQVIGVDYGRASLTCTVRVDGADYPGQCDVIVEHAGIKEMVVDGTTKVPVSRAIVGVPVVTPLGVILTPMDGEGEIDPSLYSQVEWSSSDERIASVTTIDGKGHLVLEGAGATQDTPAKVWITATLGSLTATYELEVRWAYPESVNVTSLMAGEKTTMYAGEKGRLKAEIVYELGGRPQRDYQDSLTILWEDIKDSFKFTNNPSSATTGFVVDVEATNEDECVITATVEARPQANGSITLNSDWDEVGRFYVTVTDNILYVGGQTETATAVLEPKNPGGIIDPGITINWPPDSHFAFVQDPHYPMVATVTGVSVTNGPAPLNATLNGTQTPSTSDQFELEVRLLKLDKFEINPSSLSLNVGDKGTFTLEATYNGTPLDETNFSNINWSVTNLMLASVNPPTGAMSTELTAAQKGTTTLWVTAEYEGVKYSAQSTVTIGYSRVATVTVDNPTVLNVDAIAGVTLDDALTATIATDPTGGQIDPAVAASLNWYSTRPSVATVNSNGVVKPLTAGDTQIKAYVIVDGVRVESAPHDLTVRWAQIQDLTVDAPGAMKTGETRTITAKLIIEQEAKGGIPDEAELRNLKLNWTYDGTDMSAFEFVSNPASISGRTFTAQVKALKEVSNLEFVAALTSKTAIQDNYFLTATWNDAYDVVLSLSANSVKVGGTVTASVTIKPRTAGGVVDTSMAIDWPSLLGTNFKYADGNDTAKTRLIEAINTASTTPISLQVSAGGVGSNIVYLSSTWPDGGSLSLSDISLTIDNGGQAALSVTAKNGDGTAATMTNVNWYTSNSSIAYPDPATGTSTIIRGVAPGTTSVWVEASVNGQLLRAYCTVTVGYDPVTGISVTPDSLTADLIAGVAVSEQLQVTLNGTNPTDSIDNSLYRQITWYSSNPSAIAVNPSTGALTVKGEGTGVEVYAVVDLGGGQTITSNKVILNSRWAALDRVEATTLPAMYTGQKAQVSVTAYFEQNGTPNPTAVQNATVAWDDGYTADTMFSFRQTAQNGYTYTAEAQALKQYTGMGGVIVTIDGVSKDANVPLLAKWDEVGSFTVQVSPTNQLNVDDVTDLTAVIRPLHSDGILDPTLSVDWPADTAWFDFTWLTATTGTAEALSATTSTQNYRATVYDGTSTKSSDPFYLSAKYQTLSVLASPATVDIQVGGDEMVNLVVKDAAGNAVTTSNHSWRISNTSVASLTNDDDASRQVTGGSVGVTTGTVQATTPDGQTVQAAFTVNVGINSTTVMTINDTALPAAPNNIARDGVNYPLTVSFTPTTGIDATLASKVSWRSSNTAVATVDSNGNVTLVGGGTATITAYIQEDGLNLQATTTVTSTWAPLTAVELGSYTTHVYAGQSQTITATLKYQDGGKPDPNASMSVVWYDGGNSTVQFSSQQNATNQISVTARALEQITTPTTNVSVTVGGVTLPAVNVPLTADWDTIGSIRVTQSASVLNVGDSATLTTTVTPTHSNGILDKDLDITWPTISTTDYTVQSQNVDGSITQVTALTASPQQSYLARVENGTEIKNSQNAVQLSAVYPELSQFELYPTIISVDVGKTKSGPTLTAIHADGSAVTEARSWTTSDASIATIDANGNIIGVAKGTTYGQVSVTVNQKTYTKSFTINVGMATPTSIAVTLSAGSASMTAGVATGAADLTATVEPQGDVDPALQNAVTWRSSDTNVATVDQNGLVTPVGGGTATIYAELYASGVSLSKGYQVTVAWATPGNLTFNIPTSTMYAGQQQTITATLLTSAGKVDPNVLNGVMNWSVGTGFTVEHLSSSNGVYTARLTANAQGSTTVTATIPAGSVSGTSTTVTANWDAVDRISIAPSSWSLSQNSSVILTATLYPTNPGGLVDTSQALTWTSSDTTLILANGAGYSCTVTTAVPFKVGSGTIEVKNSAGKTATASITTVNSLIRTSGLIPSSLSIAVNQSDYIALDIETEDLTTPNVSSYTWTVGDTALVTPTGGSEQGVTVTGLLPGTTDVTVNAVVNGQPVTDTCTVTVIPDAYTGVDIDDAKLPTTGAIAGTIWDYALTATPIVGANYDPSVALEYRWSGLPSDVIDVNASTGEVRVLSGRTNATVKVELYANGVKVGEDTAGFPVRWANVMGITLQPTSITMYAGQKDAVVTATPVIEDGGIANPSDTYSINWSGASSVFSFYDAGGLSTRIESSGEDNSSGTGTLYVNGVASTTASTATLSLISNWDEISSITLSKSYISMQAGGSDTLTATLNPRHNGGLTHDPASPPAITWEAQLHLVTIPGSGLQVVVNGGTVAGTDYVSAGIAGGPTSDFCRVDVKNNDLSGVQIQGTYSTPIILGVTPSVQLNAYISPSVGSDPNLVKNWSSNNPSVAQVSNTGLVTIGSTPGTAMITLTVGGYSDTCAIVVEYGKVSSISISPLTDTIYVGETCDFTATVTMADAGATAPEITWTQSSGSLGLTSSKLNATQSKAVVTGNRPIAVGVVTAFAGGESSTAQVEVKDIITGITLSATTLPLMPSIDGGPPNGMVTVNTIHTTSGTVPVSSVAASLVWGTQGSSGTVPTVTYSASKDSATFSVPAGALTGASGYYIATVTLPASADTNNQPIVARCVVTVGSNVFVPYSTSITPYGSEALESEQTDETSNELDSVLDETEKNEETNDAESILDVGTENNESTKDPDADTNTDETDENTDKNDEDEDDANQKKDDNGASNILEIPGLDDLDENEPGQVADDGMVVTAVLWDVVPAQPLIVGLAPERASVRQATSVMGEYAQRKVEYTSSQTQVATIDADGVITALEAGETELTARVWQDNGWIESDALRVEVRWDDITGFAPGASTEPITLSVGMSQEIIMSLQTAGGGTVNPDARIELTSEDTSVAGVSGSSIVGIGQGNTLVTIEAWADGALVAVTFREVIVEDLLSTVMAQSGWDEMLSSSILSTETLAQNSTSSSAWNSYPDPVEDQQASGGTSTGSSGSSSSGNSGSAQSDGWTIGGQNSSSNTDSGTSTAPSAPSTSGDGWSIGGATQIDGSSGSGGSHSNSGSSSSSSSGWTIPGGSSQPSGGGADNSGGWVIGF
ncbi:Ig-like domain-containing protein [Eubacteriales bacterium OttesenSCG-928-A19]|nr:Ig-like domain-containing protein [Eubacteriales bacterium OttesenSCG-928-A19]